MHVENSFEFPIFLGCMLLAWDGRRMCREGQEPYDAVVLLGHNTTRVSIKTGGWHSGVALGLGRIFVSQGYANRVRVFRFDGSRQTQWGERGCAHGQFDHPSGLHLAANELYVCDLMNRRMQVFTPDGKFHRAFHVPAKPRDVVVLDEVFVASRRKVCAFTTDGVLLRCVANFPRCGLAGLMILPSDHVVVLRLTPPRCYYDLVSFNPDGGDLVPGDVSSNFEEVLLDLILTLGRGEFGRGPKRRRLVSVSRDAHIFAKRLREQSREP